MLLQLLARLKAAVQDELGDDLVALVALSLTVPQAMVLFRLVGVGPMTMTGLQAVSHRSQPATSALVAELEARGLVERRPHAEDARRVEVRATRTGAKEVRRVQAVRRRGLKRVLARLPKSLVRDLERDLGRAADILEAS